MTTFSATAARDDFARILELVLVTNTPVGITRYGNLVASVVPNRMNKTSETKDLVTKYAGMWANADWTGKIGKPARRFYKKNLSL